MTSLGLSLQQQIRQIVQTQYHKQPQSRNRITSIPRPIHVRNFPSHPMQSSSKWVLPSIVQLTQCESFLWAISKSFLWLVSWQFTQTANIVNTIAIKISRLETKQNKLDGFNFENFGFCTTFHPFLLTFISLLIRDKFLFWILISAIENHLLKRSHSLLITAQNWNNLGGWFTWHEHI